MGHAPGGQKEKGVEWIFSCFFLSMIPVRVRNLLIATIKDGCSLNCFVGLTSSFFPFPLHVFFISFHPFYGQNSRLSLYNNRTIIFRLLRL